MSSFAKLEILHNINNLVLLFVENSRNYQKKDKIWFFQCFLMLKRNWIENGVLSGNLYFSDAKITKSKREKRIEKFHQERIRFSNRWVHTHTHTHTHTHACTNTHTYTLSFSLSHSHTHIHTRFCSFLTILKKSWKLTSVTHILKKQKKYSSNV